MAPQIPIETPQTVEESFQPHFTHIQLQKKQLTQFNCHFEDQGQKVHCEPFTRYFWECTHNMRNGRRTQRYHWETTQPNNQTDI